ncbi:MAG TPA: pitrilysin family protein, partial [Dongiaceae bacterium]|nr:pitrilysin family protein [Dongiaceae bacterium]
RTGRGRVGTAARGLVLAVALLAPLFVGGTAAFAVEIQRVVGASGVAAWLVEDHGNPIVSVAVGFHGGAALDPAGKAGLAQMVSVLLDEGAGDLDSQAFQRRLAELAIELGFDAGMDEFTGTLRTLSDRRDDAFDLLRLALTAPRFDRDAVDRMRGQLQARLVAQADDPGDIAGRVWWRTSFPDHPYGRPAEGTVASLGAIAPDDLRGFIAQRFARDNLVVGVVGDITAAELAPLLDRTFGALPAAAAPAALPEAAPKAAGALVVVPKGVPQSVVLFGHQGVKRDDPDYYAAYVVNHVLGGGGFSSRLTYEVRETRGLAYSIGTWLNTLDRVGLVQGQVATQNARVAETLELVRAEWRRMAEAGPTPEELADAKTYLTGSYPLRFSSTASTAGVLVAVQLEGFGIDYIERRNSYIEAVTLDDARRVARRLLDPARLTVVVVGEPEGVTATQDPPPDDGT